ncbi:MAG: hypothetical protein MMC33_008694 [Icmadophila ericetorum]|nr:hypothetical protein [Icmadophila ericetorum]
MLCTWSKSAFRKGDKSLKPLIESLNSVLKVAERGSPDIDLDTTSFSVQLTSSIETLWTHEYAAPKQGNYSDVDSVTVTGDTVFRIASCSKTFTVLALLLQNGISLDDPVSKHIPQLLGESKVDWSDVSLRSLASQLSGIAKEYGMLDLTDQFKSPETLERYGFPPLSDGDRYLDDFFEGLKKQNPVFEPNFESTYSNLNFMLLSVALENLNSLSFDDIIQRRILDPLQMKHTSLTKPLDSMGIIPAGEPWWDWDAKYLGPTGGIYSSGNDLSTYLRGILSYSLLSVGRTNAWLKPQSFSPDLNSAYGMPWEIVRTQTKTFNGRTMDMYTKAGDLPGYHSLLALFPEYDLGLTILTARPIKALEYLQKQLTSSIVAEAESIFSDDLQRYTGTYSDAATNTSLSLAFSSGKGLIIESWISRGVDFFGTVLPHLRDREGLQGNATMRGRSAWVLPSNLFRDRNSTEVECWKVIVVKHRSADPGDGIWDTFCFNDASPMTYGTRPIFEFLFKK